MEMGEELCYMGGPQTATNTSNIDRKKINLLENVGRDKQTEFSWMFLLSFVFK